MVYKKVCEICGSKFDGGAPNAKYCSTACKKEAKQRSQRKYWEKHGKPWFQQDVGSSGDTGDDRVPDSKDPQGSGDIPAGSQDLQGSGDIPAGSSRGSGDDKVNLGNEDLPAGSSRGSGDDKVNPGNKDIPAGSKQSFLDDFFEWLGW